MDKVRSAVLVFVLLFSFVAFADQRSIQKPSYEKQVGYKPSSSNLLMRLALSALLGAQKLEQALALAKKGTELFPKDPYWWEKYAQILVWTGRTEEALEPLLRLYELTGDKETAKQLFSLSVALRNYDLALRLIKEVEPPYKDAVFIYMETGKVDKLIEYLQAQKTQEAKELLAQLLFSLGRLKEALNAVQEAEGFGQKPELVLLKANILYAMREYKKALEVLKGYADKNPEDVDFWQTLSDLSWMLGDYQTAVRASLWLIDKDKARAEDYQRVVLYFSEKEPEKAIKYALEGWQKHQTVFLFERAMYIAYINQKWDTLIDIANRERSIVFEKDYLLFYYLEALIRRGDVTQAINLLEKRLKERFSTQLLAFYLYTLVELEDAQRLKKAVREYERYAVDIPEPFIVAYIKLQLGAYAFNLYRRAKLDNPVLYADVLSAYGKEDEAKDLRFKLFTERRKRLREDPSLYEDVNFMREFLYLASEFMQRSEYERLLLNLEKVLPEREIRSVYLAYLLSKQEYDKASRLVRFMRYKEEAWMALNRSLYEMELDEVRKILTAKGEIIPRRDRVEALRRLHAYEEALHLASEKLEQSPYDYRLYKQLRDLTMEHANKVEVAPKSPNEEGL